MPSSEWNVDANNKMFTLSGSGDRAAQVFFNGGSVFIDVVADDALFGVTGTVVVNRYKILSMGLGGSAGGGFYYSGLIAINTDDNAVVTFADGTYLPTT